MCGARASRQKPVNGLKSERMKGLEPSTFCMATRHDAGRLRGNGLKA